jgi:hypothetical protein
MRLLLSYQLLRVAAYSKKIWKILIFSMSKIMIFDIEEGDK